MDTALPSQPDQSFTPLDIPEELEGILEIPDRPEITGGYADVYHGFWTNPQGERVDVAIKILKALNPRSRQSDQDSLVKKAETRIKREIFFWSQTKHPNLQPFLGYRLQPQPQLVSPWCRHGDLEYYLRSNPNLSRYEKLLLIYQAGCGLHHLHSCNTPICHADIKPGNVLINDLGEAALSDFGLSRAMLDLDVTSGFTTSETVKGTFAYMAGELSSGQRASCASDVYAFGGLILTVMSNQAPFHGLSQLVILYRIMQNQPPKPDDHPDLPAQDPLWKLMRRCWDPCPAARPTISELLIKLREYMGLKQPNLQSSSYLVAPIDGGGSDYSETDFETSRNHLQEAISLSNTSKEKHDPVLEAAPKARSLSASSKDSVPPPWDVSGLITSSDQPTRRGDGQDQGKAFHRPPTEHQARLSMKPQPKFGKRPSNEGSEDTWIQEMAASWIHSAPPEIVASVSDQEKRRQEAIHELICTERDFVRDMEYLRDSWARPLQKTDIIPERHRANFVQHVFWNLDEIISVSTRLRDALDKRQKSHAIVEMIGDIFFSIVNDFEPFVRYGVHQPYSLFEVGKEKSSNQAFAQFVQETERLPESRKLELSACLTRPTARLPRYTLLLESVIKYTADHHPDKVLLEKVVKTILRLLKRVSEESGETERRVILLQLDQQSMFWDVEQGDLQLRDKNRELLRRGRLRLREGRENYDLQVFLLDHALLMVNERAKQGRFHLYKQPIPLGLLVVEARLEYIPKPPRTSLFELLLETDSGIEYPIWLRHLGRKGYTLMLRASTLVDRDKWLEEIVKQQEVIRTRNATFETLSLDGESYRWCVVLNCAVPLNGGDLLAYGSKDGVHLPDLRAGSSGMLMCLLALPDVKQVNVLLECGLLVLLSERSVMTVPLDATSDPKYIARPKRVKKVATDISFFKVGTYLGRTLLCLVNGTRLRSTIKILEPNYKALRGKKMSSFKEFILGGNDAFRVFKEFEIPTNVTSVHFLRDRFCVGCAEGFQMVNLDTLAIMPLLHPTDHLLDFVRPRLTYVVALPSAIYRIGNEFLLCYDDFAFYVDEAGRRARFDWIVHWEGYPTSFALHYPFVLAFEQTFIEIHNVESGQLVQIIPGKDVRCLFADTLPSIAHPAAYNGNTSSQLREGLDINVFQEQPTGGPGAAIGKPSADPYPRDEIIVMSDGQVMAVRLARSKIEAAVGLT